VNESNGGDNAKRQHNVKASNSQRIFFGFLLFAVTVAFIWLIRGFLQPIFWAIALGIVVFPLHTQIARRLEPRASLAATASVLLVMLIVVLPLIGLGTIVSGEAAALYDRIRSGEINLVGPLQWAETQVPVVIQFLERLGIDQDGLRSQISNSAATVSQFIASQALAIGQNAVRVTVYFFLMVYLLFFFLRDGARLLEGLIRALPFGDERERHLIERFAEVSRATIKGSLVVGIVQGFIGGLMFWILGIGSPVLWGVLMALLSILPAVGPALIWLPASIMLLTDGRIAAGIALIVTGTLIIGLVDNFLRPLLVGRDTRMPDYLILLSTLGGLTAFGLSGIIIGPIIAAFFLSVWKMAEEEYGDDPEA
jgi:predicted PurR-regulated permease PerM